MESKKAFTEKSYRELSRVNLTGIEKRFENDLLGFLSEQRFRCIRRDFSMEMAELPGKLCKLISPITSSATLDASECIGVKTF